MLKDGKLSVLAGTGARGCNDGKASEAMFAHPCGLAVSPEGTVFVADCGNHRIQQISPDGDVTTLAGSGSAGYKDGHGRYACFYNPCGIAIDYVSNDVLFVSDYSNNCIRAVSRSGLVSTLARRARIGETSLDSPYGIAVHIETLPSGGTEATVYVSSYHSHSLACISPKVLSPPSPAAELPSRRTGWADRPPSTPRTDWPSTPTAYSSSQIQATTCSARCLARARW